MKKYGITNKIKKKNRSNNANETKQNETGCLTALIHRYKLYDCTVYSMVCVCVVIFIAF